MSLALFVTEPPAHALADIARSAEGTPLTYPLVGSTRARLPDGWCHDVQRRHLGHGEARFHAAREALRSWRMFDQPWLRLRVDGPPRMDQLVTFASRQLGVWSVQVCRVVYLEDEEDDAGRRVGFAYGTVRPHALFGEERFELVWDRQTDDVEMTITKFSRPAHLLVTLAGPAATAVQRRFSREALDAMARAVGA